MKEYVAPLRDMAFVLRELATIEEVNRLPGCGDVNLEMAEAILTEAGKLASGVLSPLNPVGDKHGATVKDGEVTTAPGWKDAYRQFIEGGWSSLSSPAEHGGQGVPRVVSAMVEELWMGANIAFSLCPMLTHGAIEALELCGSDEQKHTYLPRLVSGEWPGTMLLTEPQAGSDLAAVRTKATPRGDGTYALEGQKIFITYGEHDLSPNILHLTLARTPTAPPGVKGISLFLVPKFLVGADGSLGARNDVRCVSLEHKLGIHGSPTAVLALGDAGGATGYLVGEENRGIEYMFIMMNAARYGVGLQGIGVSERAWQQALWYARERTQGSELGSKDRSPVAIVRHPDVRRMLLLMKSQVEAMRAVASVVAAAIDRARCHPDAKERAAALAFVELMIPVVKGWSTETSGEVTSLGIQVHGGMGYVEETGAAQLFRDARITPIYEGTTGIQGADLIGRKVARDGGAAIGKVIADMRAVQAAAAAAGTSDLTAIASSLGEGIDALEEAARFVVANYGPDVRRVAVGAVPFLMLLGTVAGGWQMARAALAAQRRLAAGEADGFLRAKVTTARFYADQVLVRAPGLSRTVVAGAGAALAIEDEYL
ncbi:MAG TPA: acyl-CoA dehydrogenase [Anaeromyxobacteraceae bacterium]|nr:acyl-CoA dehydrogenase [Anaeromyxobacteraceae bacterium]